MTDAAAIAGTYSDLKLVKSRSVAQVVIEIPIEKAESFIAAFGMPIPGKEQHVALALLKPSSTDKPGQSSQAAGPGKGRRRFDELPRSQQAALMCERVDFQKWCEVTDAEGARQAILNMCMVNSRAVLDHDDASARRWDYVLGHFRQATGQMAEMRS